MTRSLAKYTLFASLLLLIALSILTPAAYAQRPGPPADKIEYDIVTKIEDGILSVVNGEYDIFFWPVTGADIDALGLTEEQLQNVRLIPQTTSLNALLFNPYTDDSELGKYGVGTSQADNKTHFNPFGLRKFRFAMNYLISRKHIIEEIMHGSANPQYTVIGPSHPAYPHIKDVIDELGLKPEGDIGRALSLINDVFSFAQQGLRNLGYDLYKKPDSTAPAGYWWTFKRPDGTEETVTVHFLIRVEDERKDIGNYVADLLESIGIKVDRVYIERGQVFSMVYGADPRNLDWHIYTEGWVSTAESPFIEWDIAWYYAGWYYGLLPTWANLYWGYTPEHEEQLWGETIQKFIEDESLKLVQGAYKGDQYWEMARQLIKAGIQESIRVFLTENVQFFVVNKRVETLIAGKTTGLYSPFVFRTANTPDGVIKVVQFSAQAALFMSAWNPVGGMTDIYSTNIWRYVREYGGYYHPSTGEVIPMGATWKVEYGAPIDKTKIYVYRGGWMTLEEYLNSYPDDWRATVGAYAPVKVIYNYKTNAFHDGEDMTLWHILDAIAFNWEWATNDSDIRGGSDPWYHPNIESSMSYLFGTFNATTHAFEDGTLIGVEIINSTAIAIYGTYSHPISEGETAAYYLFYETWSPAVTAAMEYCVINNGPISGKTYSWYEGEAERYIDAFDTDHLTDIKQALTIIEQGDYVPPYIQSTNALAQQFGIPTYDVQDAAGKALNFINTYGHAVISNGPFYIKVYNPTELHMELDAFRDPRYPFTEDYWILHLAVLRLEIVGVELGSPSIIAPGDEINLTVTIVDHEIQPEDRQLKPREAWVAATMIDPAGNELFEVEGNRTGDYTWFIRIPGSMTEKLPDGTYTLRIKVGRFKGIPEATKDIGITILSTGKRIEEINKKISEIFKRLEQLNMTGINATELAQALNETLGSSIGLLGTEIRSVGNKVDNLATTVSTLKTSIDDIKTSQNNLAGKVDDLAKKVDELSGALGTIQTLVIVAIIISLAAVAVPFIKK